MRYFLHLSYDGTNYSGWQRQKNVHRTVQEIIEQTLLKLFKHKVTVFGCGRTDTGVHASQYVLHINLDTAPTFDLKYRLNKNLPKDIAVFEIFEGEDTQHSQYHATARTYDYFIHWKKDPVLHRHSAYYDDYDLDFEKMRAVVALIRQTKNFEALCKQPELYKNTWCQITNCELYVNEAAGRLRFTITSNRFLRGMVRYCVFFMLEVGRGKITLEDFEQILNRKKQFIPKRPAFPMGLFLSKIEYPFLELQEAHHLIQSLKRGLE